MTRIENVGSQDRSTFRKEIREELRNEERRKVMMRFGGCALVLLLLIVVPACYAAFVIAESGLGNVPVLSALLFKPGVPSRTVIPLVGEKPDQVFQIVATRMTCDPATSYLTIPIREDELTTVVQNAVDKAPPNTLPFPMKDPQIAIDDNGAEIFAHIPRSGRETTLLVRFQPMVVGGVLTVSSSRIQLGNLTLPTWASTALITSMGNTFFTTLQKNISALGELEKVMLQQGTMQLVIKSPKCI